MNKKEVFPFYQLEETPTSDVQFELIKMPEFFFNNGDHPFEAHTHGFYQIIWFKKGCGVHYVDFKEYPVGDNTLFFISPGQIHFFDKKVWQKGVIIHFNESFLSDERSSENIFLKYSLFNAFNAVPYYFLSEENITRLDYIVRELAVESLNNSQFAHKDYLKYLIKLFLISVQRVGKRGIGDSLCINNSSNHMFVRFLQMLEHHYKQIHMVKEYADCLNVSAKTLANCVYESSHLMPLKIINDRIILEAKRQLFYSDLNIKEIAFQLGFEDPSYFVKFFKRQTGCLPTVFRENY